MKTFAYRLYPTHEQRNRLLACLRESRMLYNEMLEREQQQYAENQTFFFKYKLTALFKGRGGGFVPASTVQCLADRLDKALRRYLSCRASDPRAGFPRFKSANQWHSIPLRQLSTDFTPTRPRAESTRKARYEHQNEDAPPAGGNAANVSSCVACGWQMVCDYRV